MRNIFTKILNHNIWCKGKVSFYFAVAAMIMVPIHILYLTPIMILWFLSWIIENRYKMNNSLKTERSVKVLIILFLAYYGWQLFGVSYSDNTEIGWNNVVKRISMALFPIILLSPGEMIKQNIKFLLQIFCCSTFLFILFCFGYATYNSVGFQHGILTFNPNLPVQKWLNYYYGAILAIDQHPSYLSMDVLFSVFIAFESFFDKSINIIRRFGWLIISILLLISIYFLSARAGLLAAIILLPVYFFIITFRKRNFRYALVFVLIEVLLLIPVVLKNPRVSLYLAKTSEKSFVEAANVDGRIIIWKAAISIVQKNLIFGVGTGDVNDALVKEYKNIGNKELIEKKLNVHNQFIEVLLENGIIGFTIFIFILGTMSYLAISKRQLIYMIYILIICIFFFFESMLYRFAGIAFFALFSVLLLHLTSTKGTSFHQELKE
jgi:O-antigen ligase